MFSATFHESAALDSARNPPSCGHWHYGRNRRDCCHLLRRNGRDQFRSRRTHRARLDRRAVARAAWNGVTPSYRSRSAANRDQSRYGRRCASRFSSARASSQVGSRFVRGAESMITFLQRYVFHNLGLKILSLLLATGLWFMISRDEQPAEVAVRAPIIFKNSPPSLVISSESIPETQIRVRGPERILRQLTSNEVQAEVDLSGTKPQERTFELTPKQVRHPRDVQVVQIVPSQMHLSFDTAMTRQVEIHPNVLHGNLPDGGQVVKVDTDPSRVTIS